MNQKVKELAPIAEQSCTAIFHEIEQTSEYNSQKVLSAFIKNNVSESHFYGSSGYGYGDRGRDILDAVFAEIVGAEDALVRHNFVSGTHALSTALFGILRPGDVMLSITGKPYDTLDQVIGIDGTGNGSLIDFGIKYKQVALLPNGAIDIEGIKQAIKGVKMAYLQRSRGYSLRDSIQIEAMEQLFKTIRSIDPNVIIVVDNCYGEFVENKEPLQVGADLIVGSLIKNPGGGIAATGGYIAGRKDLVQLSAYRLTTVGCGKEVGCTHDQTKKIFMGLYFAPTVVTAAVKTAVFTAKLFELMGYEVYPKFDEKRTDIIQAIKLGTKEKLIRFCQGIQKGSPVDSFVTPEPWDMPGYSDEVIMAAGAFHMGASIELSADAPLREPYAVWLQGGLTYPTAKVGILLAASEIQALHE